MKTLISLFLMSLFSSMAFAITPDMQVPSIYISSISEHKDTTPYAPHPWPVRPSPELFNKLEGDISSDLVLNHFYAFTDENKEEGSVQDNPYNIHPWPVDEWETEMDSIFAYDNFDGQQPINENKEEGSVQDNPYNIHPWPVDEWETEMDSIFAYDNFDGQQPINENKEEGSVQDNPYNIHPWPIKQLEEYHFDIQ